MRCFLTGYELRCEGCVPCLLQGHGGVGWCGGQLEGHGELGRFLAMPLLMPLGAEPPRFDDQGSTPAESRQFSVQAAEALVCIHLTALLVAAEAQRRSFEASGGLRLSISQQVVMQASWRDGAPSLVCWWLQHGGSDLEQRSGVAAGEAQTVACRQQARRVDERL